MRALISRPGELSTLELSSLITPISVLLYLPTMYYYHYNYHLRLLPTTCFVITSLLVVDVELYNINRIVSRDEKKKT